MGCNLMSRLQLRIAKAATICYSMPNIAGSGLEEKQAGLKNISFEGETKAGTFEPGSLTECLMEDFNAKNSA